MKIMVLLVTLLVSMAAIAAKPVINLSITSVAGAISPVAAWSVTGAVSCAGSGAWSGQKPLSGTETLPPQTANGEITLTCVSDKGTSTVEWTVPTQNTNGSALTNLAGYYIHEGAVSGMLFITLSVDNPAITALDVESPPGPRYWAMRAVDSAGEQSDLTPEVTKIVQADTATKTVPFTVQTVPNAPSNITIK